MFRPAVEVRTVVVLISFVTGLLLTAPLLVTARATAQQPCVDAECADFVCEDLACVFTEEDGVLCSDTRPGTRTIEAWSLVSCVEEQLSNVESVLVLATGGGGDDVPGPFGPMILPNGGRATTGLEVDEFLHRLQGLGGSVRYRVGWNGTEHNATIVWGVAANDHQHPDASNTLALAGGGRFLADGIPR